MFDYVVYWIDDRGNKTQSIIQDENKAKEEFQKLQDEGYDAWISKKIRKNK